MLCLTIVHVMKQRQFHYECCSSGIDQAVMLINFNHGTEIINRKKTLCFVYAFIGTDCMPDFFTRGLTHCQRISLNSSW